MKCPHCNTAIHESWKNLYGISGIDDADNSCLYMVCPECKKIIVKLVLRKMNTFGNLMSFFDKIIYPEFVSRTNLEFDGLVDDKFFNDYKESCAVFDKSSKASAALSRRCLQNLLREKLSVPNSNLNSEIDYCIKNKNLPAELLGMIDEIRNIGNFAAHPLKDTNTSEIVDVEPYEAEACLDILEEMFEYLFVRPAKIKERQDKLNTKLQTMGKPEIKKS